MTPIVRSLSIASFSRRSRFRLKTVELPKGIEHRPPEGAEAWRPKQTQSGFEEYCAVPRQIVAVMRPDRLQ